MKEKIYSKWWFWVICAFVFFVCSLIFLGVLGILLIDETACPQVNSQCEAELQECKTLGLDMVAAWDDYSDALYDYCKTDPYNNICLTLP